MKEVCIGEIIVDEEIDIEEIQLDVVKEYPELENLEIIPTTEEQNFKSEKYGYGGIKVNPIISEELSVTPNTEVQKYEGLFNKVEVAGDKNLVAENIRQGTNIFGIDGKMEGAWDSSQIRQCISMFQDNKEMTEAPYFDTRNVITMSQMFRDCKSLEEVPLYNTEKLTSMYYMFYNCNKLKKLPLYETSNVAMLNSAFRGCSSLEELPLFNTSNVTDMSSMCNGCDNLKKVPLLDASKITSISSVFAWCTNLTDFGGFLNLGKGYTRKTANYANYGLGLQTCTSMTHESLMNVINNLYDLNLTYDVANGGTLYQQTLNLGTTNLAKLTEEEIAIATAKGWNVS